MIREAIRRDDCETRSQPGEYDARRLADKLPKPLTILPKYLNLPPKGSNCIRLAFSLRFRRPTRFQFHRRGVQTRLNLTHTTRSNAKRSACLAHGEGGECIYKTQLGREEVGIVDFHLNPADHHLASRTSTSTRHHPSFTPKTMQLRPRHGHSGDFTPSELAEMLVDPYDDAPKCELPSSYISGHFFKLNIRVPVGFARHEGHHRGRLRGYPPSRLGQPVVPLQAHRVSCKQGNPGYTSPRAHTRSCHRG